VPFLRVSEGHGFDFSSWTQAVFTEAPCGYFQSLQITVSCAISVSSKRIGYNATDEEVNTVYRMLSYTRVGYYAITATIVTIQDWMKRQFFFYLTLFLLREFLQRELSQERDYLVVAELGASRQGTLQRLRQSPFTHVS
jgi:hypothetical protein